VGGGLFEGVGGSQGLSAGGEAERGGGCGARGGKRGWGIGGGGRVLCVVWESRDGGAEKSLVLAWGGTRGLRGKKGGGGGGCGEGGECRLSGRGIRV